MIKYIMILLIFCFNNAICIQNDGAYEALKGIERTIISQLPQASNEVSEHLKPFTDNQQEEAVEAESHTSFPELRVENQPLDFSKYSFKQIIANFILILQTKLDARNNHIGYKTRYEPFQDIDCSDDECTFDEKGKHIGDGYIDPYYIKIKMDNKYYNFSLCYDGKSSQVGNCVLRESPNANYYRKGEEKRRQKAQKWQYVCADTKLETLLLALEVARRKVHDGEKQDQYDDLPVFCAIVMAKALKNSRPDHSCFNGNDEQKRKEPIKKLLRQYNAKGTLQERIIAACNNLFPNEAADKVE